MIVKSGRLAHKLVNGRLVLGPSLLDRMNVFARVFSPCRDGHGLPLFPAPVVSG